MVIVMVAFYILILGLFSKSCCRVHLIRKALTHERNQKILSFALKVTVLITVCVAFELVIWGLNIYNQGFFGTLALVTNACFLFNTALMLFLCFLMVTQLAFDFTLSTKVQADGQVLIVGLSRRGRELFKLYIDEE